MTEHVISIDPALIASWAIAKAMRDSRWRPLHPVSGASRDNHDRGWGPLLSIACLRLVSPQRSRLFPERFSGTGGACAVSSEGRGGAGERR